MCRRSSRLLDVFCCAAAITKHCYYKNHPTFFSCMKLLVWQLSWHPDLIHDMNLSYSHCQSYWKLLQLPVLQLGSRVLMCTRIPSAWMEAAAGNLNQPHGLAYPDSTSSVHPVYRTSSCEILDPRLDNENNQILAIGSKKFWFQKWQHKVCDPYHVNR